MVAAFAGYLAGLLVLSRAGARVRLRAVIALACAIQVLPLAGPVLLSTDVYTYWDYGRIAAVHDGNPYVDVPNDYPDDPAYPLMGSYWYDTTSVYGPGFTLVSEVHAEAVGESPEAAAWTYRTLAALAMVALVLLAARLSLPARVRGRLRRLESLAGDPLRGGRPQRCVDDGLRPRARSPSLRPAGGRSPVSPGVPRSRSSGCRSSSCRCGSWRPAASAGASTTAGLAAAAVVIVAIATWRYGLEWAGAAGPLATNLAEDRAWYAIPVRIASLGIHEGAVAAVFAGAFVVAYLWLLREAWHGRARLALTAGLLLVCTSWLVPWYAVWAVPLAAVEEDRTARVLALALSAYLLRDAVPI